MEDLAEESVINDFNTQTRRIAKILIAILLLAYIIAMCYLVTHRESTPIKICIYKGADGQWYKDTDGCMKEGFYPCDEPNHTHLIEYHIIEDKTNEK